jgi:hypothetical protein
MLWSRVERAQQIGSHSSNQDLVDAGLSEQYDGLPDERRPQQSSNAVVHTDTNDARGIDVAFYATLFQVPPPEESRTCWAAAGARASVFFHSCSM